MSHGRIVNIQHFCIHDGPGIRTTVFLKGCPLKCQWCSNPNMQKYEVEIAYAKNKCIRCKKCIHACSHNALTLDEDIIIDREKCTTCGDCIEVCPGKAIHFDGQDISCDDVMDEVVADMNFYHNSGGGLTLSGGEAITQKDFAISILNAAKAIGIHTALETSAYAPFNDFYEISQLVDHLFVDIKHACSKKHQEVAGVHNALILENIIKIQATHPNLHIRIPVIPSINDTKEELDQIAQFLNPLSGIKDIELLQYHNLGSTRYAQIGKDYPLQHVEKYSFEYLTDLVDFFRKQCPSKTIICQAS